MLFSRQERTMSRLTVTFGKKAARLIEQLAKDRSKAEVIREALALESVFQDALTEGATLILRDSDGRERQLVRVEES